MNAPDWQWNEIQQVGTDYTDLKEVERYDQRMGNFRNVDAENAGMLAMLALPDGASVIDIGCGTGRFAIASATAGLAVTAVDVSQMMLDYVSSRAQNLGLGKITTQHAGFITMNFPPETFDAAVSGAALHHLPDLWKLVALQNIARILKPGGQFILRDVVFSLNGEEAPAECFERFSCAFPNMREGAARHIAKEYSTYDWIMQGLLQRAGFEIKSQTKFAESFLVYHCAKR